MTRHTKFLSLIAGAALALAGTGFAAQSKAPAPSAPAAKHATKKAAKAMTSVTQGKIKTINDTQLVVERKMKKGSKDMTFVLNSSTQKQGDLKPGGRVTVHYRKDNNQEIATLVRAAKAGKSGKSAKR